MIREFSVGPIGENVYIIEQPGVPVVVVDPGAEADRLLGKIDAAVSRAGTRSVLIACTHGHLDHVAAVPELMFGLRGRGLEVRLFAPMADRDYFGAPAEETNRRAFQDILAMMFFQRFWTPIPEADEYFEDGQELPGTGIIVIHTPGHTRGSSCFLAENGSALLSGDTLFRSGRGRTDNFDGDEADIVASIRERLCCLPDGVRVWPGHGEATTIGREKRLYL